MSVTIYILYLYIIFPKPTMQPFAPSYDPQPRDIQFILMDNEI